MSKQARNDLGDLVGGRAYLDWRGAARPHSFASTR